MKESIHDIEATKAIREFFEKKFPLEQKEFESKHDLLNFYVDIEIELSEELKSLFDELEPIPLNKVKVAHNTLLENLIISFELNGHCKAITKAIHSTYKKVIEKIIKDTKKIKDPKKIAILYISDKLNQYSNLFSSLLSEKLERDEFPQFLLSKFIQLIRNKYLLLLSEKNIDVSYFFLSDKLISLIDIYQDIFIYRKQFLFNAKNKEESTHDFFELFILSNNINLKNREMKYLDYLIKDFKFFVHIFNLDEFFENKNFNENYNLNKLIEKYEIEFINISEEEVEFKKEKILKKIMPNISRNKNFLINIILSYTLVFNYLVKKNTKTKDIELYMTNNYTSSACMKVLLDNTLRNFEIYLNSEEIRDFSQSVLIKDLFETQNYSINKSYDINEIKETLINNPKNEKLKKISNELFKGLYTEKYNKLLELLLSLNQSYKDKNIRNINLTPLNPKITSTHCYIFISGFLSEISDHYEEWKNMTLNMTSNNSCYFYNWPGDSLSNVASETLLNLGLTILSNYSKNNQNNNNNPNTEGINKCKMFDPGKSFVDSSNKAALSGKILAFILASKLFFKFQTITIIGFSLGTHVAKHCLKQMYEFQFKHNIQCDNIIKDVVLIAGATCMKGNEEKFKNIFNNMINGKLINCFSKEDQVLNYLYTSCMDKKPIGNSELELNGYKNLVNIDFTPFHLGHTDYRSKMDLVMSKVDLYI